MLQEVIRETIPFSPFGIIIESPTKGKLLDAILLQTKELLLTTRVKLPRNFSFENEFSYHKEIPTDQDLSIWFVREDDIMRNMCTVKAFVIPQEVFACCEAFESESIMKATVTIK